MTLRIELFQENHLQHWDSGSPEFDYFLKELIKTREPYLTFTGWIGDKVLGFGGIDLLWMNANGRWVGDLWLNINSQVLLDSSQKTQIFWQLKKAMKEAISKTNLCRLQCVVDSEYGIGNRFAKLMGMKLEAERIEKFSYNEGYSNLYGMVF